jgi:hypothetical protein
MMTMLLLEDHLINGIGLAHLAALLKVASVAHTYVPPPAAPIPVYAKRRRRLRGSKLALSRLRPMAQVLADRVSLGSPPARHT